MADRPAGPAAPGPAGPAGPGLGVVVAVTGAWEAPLVADLDRSRELLVRVRRRHPDVDEGTGLEALGQGARDGDADRPHVDGGGGSERRRGDQLARADAAQRHEAVRRRAVGRDRQPSRERSP